MMTTNIAFQLLQLFVTSGAAYALFKGGVAMRDAVRDLKSFTQQLRHEVDDHEDRIRLIEGITDRRHRERRHAE